MDDKVPEIKEWEDPWRPPTMARIPLHRRVAGVCIALALAGFMILCASANRVVIALGAVVFGLGCGSLVLIVFLEILYLLFRRGQVRLSELMLLVAVLGNVIGLTWRQLEQGVEPDEFRWLFPVLCVGIVFWIVGGAAWGLWVSKMLGYPGGWQRVGLMLLGWAALPALLGFPGLLGCLAKGMAGGGFLWLLCGLVGLIAAVWIVRTAWRLGKGARFVDYDELTQPEPAGDEGEA